MEEIAEGLFRFIGAAIRWLLFEFVFQFLIFNLGRLVLLLLTLGKYPRGDTVRKDETKIGLFGLAIIFGLIVAIGIYNNVS